MAIDNSEDGNVTKEDFKKTLQVYAKAIELQILNSQQQEKILENQEKQLDLLEKIEHHFSNGFRSELKEYTHQEVLEVKTLLNEVLSKLIKSEEVADERCAECSKEMVKSVATHSEQSGGCSKKITEVLESIDEKMQDLQGSFWRQAWLWGGIALFTVVNAIATIISLWANGFILGGGGKG